MKDIKLEFTHHYFNCDNWKRKEVSIINNIISKGRLNEIIRFSNFGTIGFDAMDSKHQFPIFNDLNKDETKRANSIVYNIIKPETVGYDKLIIYQTITRNGGFYGFMTYNTETGKFFHKFFIHRDVYDLMISLNKYLCKLNFN